MRLNAARRIACACTVTVAGALAAIAPATATASLGEQCSGVEIGGQGSSLQKVAQETLWDPGFNKSTSKKACSGSQGAKKTPAIKYNPSGSGAGLRSFGVEFKKAEEVKFGPENSFVGTDEPPNEKQIGEVVKQESTETKESLLIIPVAQEAVAVVVNLPSGCTAKSTTKGAEGRLVLNNATLEGIFAGKIKTWGGIKDGGDSLSPESCGTEAIQPVVRFDGSGTTHIFKRYLNLIDTAKLETAEGEKSWGELSEGALNTVWPTAAGVLKPVANGGGEVLKKVLEAPGRIGYANVAEARANPKFVPPEGGEGKQSFWVELENATKGKGAKIKYTYTDPAEKGDVAEKSNSNCAKTGYTNGKDPFPPPSVKGLWNEVTTSAPEAKQPIKEKGYALCGLTFDLAFTKYSLFEGKGATLGEATTVNNFLVWVTEKKGGQAALLGNDYSPLPKSVATIAAKGAAEIAF